MSLSLINIKINNNKLNKKLPFAQTDRRNNNEYNFHYFPNINQSITLFQPDAGDAQKMDAYTLVSLVGVGSYGRVYKATNNKTQATVALKIIGMVKL